MKKLKHKAAGIYFCLSLILLAAISDQNPISVIALVFGNFMFSSWVFSKIETTRHDRCN